MDEDEKQLTETRDRERPMEDGRDKRWVKKDKTRKRKKIQEDVVGGAVIGLAKENGHVVGDARTIVKRDEAGQGDEGRGTGSRRVGGRVQCVT